MSKPQENFRAKAPKLMARVINEFGFSVEDAAADAGNAGYESGGFLSLQEIKPTVPGSKGGYGWFQWTGPRRVQFMEFCKTRNIEPSSDIANIEFHVHELKTTERRAVDAVKKAVGLRAKVEAFERAYERAGIKNYAHREEWARLALHIYKGLPTVEPEPKPIEPTKPVTPPLPPAVVPKRGLLKALIDLLKAIFTR